MSRLTLSKSPCSKCSSSDAYHEWDDGHGYCFSCRTYFRPDGEALDREFSFEYLPWRGVSKESFQFYNVKTKIGPNGEPLSLGYLYPNGAVKVRHLQRKDFFSRGEISKAGLFGQDKFEVGNHKYVTITEGELDAISLYQILRSPCVSVTSATSAKRDCTVAREWLNSFERIYLAFDNDSAGREAAAAVASLFDPNRVYQVKFGKHKDANQYLRVGEGDDLKAVWWTAKRFLPENVVSSFSDFKAILSQRTNEGIPYPFPTLTAMTYGIRPSESILITAQEGVGKTEIMHAIEYQLLRETKDAVGALFLEEPKQRHLQAIAGLHLQQPAHLPDVGLSSEEVSTALQEAIGRDDRLHLYSHFGSDDPGILLDTIRFLVSGCDCRYILFDHIGMSVSGLQGEDERRALDYLSTRLEMMVKELNFSLILVSHVNDAGQTRGSRYISKIADIRIDAHRDVVIGSNSTTLTVSKNRFCGKTGPAGKLLFNPITYSYTELEDDLSYKPSSTPSLEGDRTEQRGRKSQEQRSTILSAANDNLPVKGKGSKAAA